MSESETKKISTQEDRVLAVKVNQLDQPDNQENRVL
jgi:hypothetical protein